MVNLTIDGIQCQANAGDNVLQAALDAGIQIPHLCFMENVSSYGACRLCLVEVTRGQKKTMVASCTYPVLEGIVVETNTPEVQKSRRMVMELILAMAPEEPKVKALAKELGVTTMRFEPEDNQGCISCGLCERVCAELVGAHAINFANRGSQRKVIPPFEKEPEECIGCGACVYVCPTDCIKMEDVGETRNILRWQRRLKLQSCKKCGQNYAPQAQLAFLQQRIKELPPADWFDLCPDCR